MWSADSLSAVKDIKKSILRRKIILNIIIESYSTYDKIFRYIHMLLALISPLVIFINQQVNGSTVQTNDTALVFSAIVAGMIKLKDYIKFDKIKETAKQQSIKYDQLYQRIDREMRKSEAKRQNEEEFIYWINREFTNLEIYDPELPNSLRNKFIELCKEKNIPYDEDVTTLEKLMNEDKEPETQNIHVNQSIQQNIPRPITPKAINTAHILNMSDQNTRRKSIRSNSPTEELALQNNKIEFHAKLQSMNTHEDLNWAIERLSNLDEENKEQV